MKTQTVFLFFFVVQGAFAQVISADSVVVCDSRNISVQAVSHDSLASTFVLCIRESVPAHFHKSHSERVIILEGEGEFTLDGKVFRIRPHDIITIPAGSVHALKVSRGPVKAVSIQAPYFDGSDRFLSGQ